jgi:dextransucrase
VASVLLAMAALVQFPDQAQAAPPAAAEITGDVFTSGPELDKHVIFQSFALYQPDDHDTYTKLAASAQRLANLGITDLWAPPPYRVANDSKYREGYAIADRYDLGNYGKGPTKYGTEDQLRTAITALHAAGLRAEVDVVPNQVIGLPGRHVVPVTSVDNAGNPNNPDISGLLYAAYTSGTAPGQTEHGLIKSWDTGDFNGTSPQNQGLYRVLVGDDGEYLRYFGPGDARNHLPEWLANTEAATYGKINTVDDYVLADSYFAIENANSDTDAVYAPVLFFYTDPRPGVMAQSYLDYARAHGYPGATDDEVRAALLAAGSTAIGPLTDAYLLAQPGYSAGSEGGITALRFDTPANNPADINQDVLQYEFLIGNDLDTTKPIIQQEQLNWQKYLLDFGFDGFRIDAASHVNTKLLRDEVAQRTTYFAGEDPLEHLSYIESYTAAQVPFERSNNQGQLVLDSAQYDAFLAAFGKKQQAVYSVFTNSVVNRLQPAANPIPNWSFVNNHDQEHNVLATIPLTPEEAGGAVPGTLAYELKQFAKYDADRGQNFKQYAPYNVPIDYAVMLTNKDTVPTVFYGDLYKSTGSYMRDKTPYYDDITKLLKIRKRYVSGDQQVTLQPTKSSGELGGDLVSSARLGTSRNTGVAVIAGNYPNLNDTIKINMGRQHAYQSFRDAMGYDPDIETTDANGVLTVSVHGFNNVQIDGYLAAYVPGATAPAVTNVTRPVIQGTATVGRILTATPGRWSVPAPTLTYQWNRNGTPIDGATSARYTVTADDAYSDLTVTVTASAPGYRPGTATSAARFVRGSTTARAGARATTVAVGGRAG